MPIVDGEWSAGVGSCHRSPYATASALVIPRPLGEGCCGEGCVCWGEGPAMGGMLDKPSVEKETDRGQGKLGDGTVFTYGASAM